jgi:hypothetical protein
MVGIIMAGLVFPRIAPNIRALIQVQSVKIPTADPSQLTHAIKMVENIKEKLARIMDLPTVDLRLPNFRCWPPSNRIIIRQNAAI